MDKEPTVKTDALVKKISKHVKEARGLSQPRSNFFLDKFVICQHDTIGKQRQQCIMELVALRNEIESANESIELAKIDADQSAYIAKSSDANEFHKRREILAKRRAERTIENEEIRLAGLEREADHILKVLDSLPAYTLEMVEAEESEYWGRKLGRQAILNQRGSTSGLGSSNLDAMLQYFAFPGQDVNNFPMASPGAILGAFVASETPPAPPAEAEPPTAP
jgi:hypothetical protein